MARLSVIVPIYNASKYLDKCIRSIVNQTFQDIEIILINDGSIDNSLSICSKYAEKDDRIKIINQDNKGVSVARNKGIEISTSQYITFIDPDDDIDIEMYKDMLNNIVENDCDVCLCNYMYKNRSKEKEIKLPFKEGKYEYNSIKKIIISMLGGSELDDEPIMGSVWRGIYKKDIIQKHLITFPINIRPMQDLVFIVEYLSVCKTLYINENSYYNYYIHANSAITGYKKGLWNNNKRVYDLLESIAIKNNIEVDKKQNLKNRLINMALGSISNEAHIDNRNKLKDKLNNISLILKDEKVKNSIGLVNSQKLKLRKKIILLCIKMKLSLPLYIYYFFIQRIKMNY